MVLAPAGPVGAATAISFQPTGGGKAVITGDLVTTADEVNPVIKALRDKGISPEAPSALVARQCLRQIETADLDDGQFVQAILVRAQTIGRTEAHAKVAMKDQAEGFPAMIAPHP